MPRSVAESAPDRHRVIGDVRPAMVKADLPKGEPEDVPAITDAEIGACLDFARRAVGWTVDQLARELGKDSKQVARWMRGEERTQIAVVFNVAVLRKPFVIALAKLSGEFRIETTLHSVA
jgi:hypothetical protein